MHPKGLRWHGWARTRNGHISTYVRVRAWTIAEAVEKIPRKAYKEWREDKSKKEREQFPHPLEDWICIGVSIHTDDQNSIDDREWPE